MWEAISYVSSGLTLIAFIAATAAYVYLRRSSTEERLIKSAAESDRADLVRHAIEAYHVNVEHLSKQQQYNIVIEQLHGRSRKYLISAIVTVTISLILAGLTAYALYNSAPRLDEPKVPESFSDITVGHPTSFASTDARGSAVQLFENGWMVAHFSSDSIYAISRNTSVHWHRRKSEYVKGRDPECDNREGNRLLRLGFCWLYNHPDSSDIRENLGKPLAKETRAWVQYQEFGDDLLIFGLPTTKPGVESGVFQTLAAVYMKGEKLDTEGSGRYRQVSEGSVNGNPYCSANWYAAHPDRMLPEPLRILISQGKCSSVAGADEFGAAGAQIRLR